MFDCENAGNSTVLTLHPEEECFSVLQVLNMILSALSLALLSPFLLLFGILYFQPSKYSNHIAAKFTPFPFLSEIIFKVILEFLFTFFKDVKFIIYIYIYQY